MKTTHRFQDLVSFDAEQQLLVGLLLVKFSNFLIEETLLVSESFRTTCKGEIILKKSSSTSKVKKRQVDQYFSTDNGQKMQP